MDVETVRSILDSIVCCVEANNEGESQQSLADFPNRAKDDTPAVAVAAGAGARAARALHRGVIRGRSCFAKLDLSAPCDRPLLEPEALEFITECGDQAFPGVSDYLGDEALPEPDQEREPEAEPPVNETKSSLAAVAREMSPEGKNDVWDDRIAVEELLQELLKPDLAKERALARAERLETTRAKLRGALIKVHATAKLKANQTRAQRARDVEEAQRKEAAQAAQRSAEKAREALAADQERQHREVQAQKRLRKNMALVRAVAKLKVNLDSARGRSRDASIAWTSDIKVAYDPKGTLRLWDPASDPHGLQAKLPRALKHRLRNRDLGLKQRWLDNVNKT